MATMQEIAQKCGISIGTVDRVLHNRGRVNEQTRQRVLKAAEELQYMPNRAAQSLAVRKKRIHIGFIFMSSDTHPFFQDINDAARQKARELEEYGVIVTFVECRMRLDEQSGQLYRSLIYPEGCSPEVFDGIIAPGMIPQELIRQIQSRQTPVICYNNYPTGFMPLTTVTCDYYRAGTIAAGLCSLVSDEAGKVAVFSEIGGAFRRIPSYARRVEGFCSRLAQAYPQCRIEGYFFFTGNAEKDTALVRRFLEIHPGISAVYVVNPANYEICRIIHALDPRNQIRIITNDLVPVQRQMLREGIIAATITQEPDKQGSLPLELLFRYLAFNEAPPSDTVNTGLQVHIASNID